MDIWLNQNLGRGATAANRLNPYPPHSIDGQCVTAASSWSMAQGGPELFGIGDDSTAYSIFQNFRHPFFQVIQGNKDIQPGDIVFFFPNNSSAGTGYAGHVDVCTKLITAGFVGADMDWNGNHNLQYITHSFNGVAGVFRHQGAAQMTNVDRNMAIDLGVGILGRTSEAAAGDQGYLNSVVGQPVDAVIRNLVNSAEAKAFRARAASPSQPTTLQSGLYRVQ